MELRDIIKTLREAKGWSQVVAAKKLGTYQQRWGHWETGYSRPDADELLQLAEIFGVSVDDLLRGEFLAGSTVRKGSKKKGVPILAYISAGNGISPTSQDQYPLGEGLEFADLPVGMSQEEADRCGMYALYVRGDSMYPALRDGWILYVKPGDRTLLKKSDIVIFRDNDGVGWVKEIVLINDDSIVFKSIGEGPSIMKKLSELQLIERIYSIKT